MVFQMMKMKRIVNNKKDKLVRIKMMIIQTNLHIDFSEKLISSKHH